MVKAPMMVQSLEERMIMHAANGTTNVKPINFGIESDVYSVEDHNGRELIFKKAKSTGRQNYLFEAYACRKLKSLGALVPDVVRVNPKELLMTKLLGATMDDQIELYGNNQLFDDIAHNLALCANVTLQGYGRAVQDGDSFVGKYSSWSEFLNATEQLFDSPEITSELEDGNIAKLHSVWISQKSKMALDQGTLVHGDFAMSSLLVEGRRLTGIIDFGDAFIGDPLMDIAYFRLKEITKSYGRAIYRLLLRYYADTRKIAIDDELEKKIIFYMIYWGLKRLEHCPDQELRKKFVAKLKVVSDL